MGGEVVLAGESTLCDRSTVLNPLIELESLFAT
jgi:hypothetical protein